MKDGIRFPMVGERGIMASRNPGRAGSGAVTARRYLFSVLAAMVVISFGMPALAGDTPPPVALGGTMTVRSELRPGQGLTTQDFTFRVGPQTYGIGANIRNARCDLDLLVLGPRQEEVLRLESGDFNEKFFLSRMGERTLLEGSYTLRVGYYMDEPPEYQGKTLERIGFEVEFKEVRAEASRNLVMGELHQDQLRPDNGMMNSFVLNLSAGQKNLRLDVLDSQADLDFFVFPQGLSGDPLQAPWKARSYRSREYLTLDLEQMRNKFPSWDQKHVWVMVLCRMDEISAGFTILPSASEGVPLILAGLPKPSDLMAPGGRPLLRPVDRGLAATVEVSGESGGGTGCVVSPDGLVLTNYHVIAGLDGRVEKDLAIGFSTNQRKAPDSQFMATLVAFDRSKDLALLRIDRGFYGQTLPGGYRFPWLDLGDSGALSMGDELFFTGYPLLGGLGSRSTLTLTRGIVSGFEDRGYGVVIKTDALIAPGSSGGAALDSLGRLIGIPTLVVSDNASRMAYIHPVDMLPAEWYQLITRAIAKADQ